MVNSLLPAVLLSVLAQSPAPPPDSYSLIRCGHLLAVATDAPRDNVTLVIKNGLVESIVPGFDGPKLPDGARVEEIDLKQSFVLPGLIDCHVHLSHEFTPDVRLRAVTETDAEVAYKAAVNARKNLDAGFTTVRDLGGRSTVVFALRDAINRGDIVGPRVIAAGEPITVTGGHGDDSNGYRQELFGVPGADKAVADGPDECRKAVRFQIKLGADVIKLTATGGVLSASSAGLMQHFFQDELDAIAATAHSMGRKAAAHAHGTDGINAALRAGVDSIEHGTYQNDESIKLFKEKGAWYVPTLLAAKTVTANAEKPGYYIKFVADKARLVGPKVKESFRNAHAAGVKIAFGTDTGVSPHGENAQEFAIMVECGMSPNDTITCATINAAELLGLSSQIGTLEPGKQADVIAVKADPTMDASEFERVTFVMKGGKVHKR